MKIVRVGFIMKLVLDRVQVHYETLFHNMFIFGCAAYSNESLFILGRVGF